MKYRNKFKVDKEKLYVNLFDSTPAALNRIIKELGFKTKFFSFSGQKVGTSEGFPEEKSEYHTNNYGYLSNYVIGSYFVDDYELLYESGIGGDAWSPSHYHVVYILSYQKNHIINLLKKDGYLL